MRLERASKREREIGSLVFEIEKKEQPRGRKEEPPLRLVVAPAVHSAGEITKTLAMVASVRSR